MSIWSNHRLFGWGFLSIEAASPRLCGSSSAGVKVKVREQLNA
ncbi:hypothetical protein [Microcoleus sp. FACHB-672]|nr:hypothetical protein [Microcoleus sp. FACHB-672]